MTDNLVLLDRYVISGFLVSFFSAWFICRASAKKSFGLDHSNGIQKFHVQPTSRLGGVAVMMGIVLGVSLLKDSLGWSLALCAAPVFAGGLVEDVTRKVGPNVRLLLAIVSASLSYLWLGIGVDHTGIAPIDQLLSLPFASFLITVLVVAGFTNGVNIIDGFHGLAAGTTIIMMAGFLALAWSAQDALMVQICALSIASMAGFLLWNWPRGKLFLGDAGAYLIGFWVVEVGLLLVLRNPGISPMAPVVIGVFPLIETLFSMYRRKFLRNHPVNHPDALHLHTLVYRRLVLSQTVHRTPKLKNLANARVAWYFWLPAGGFCALSVVLRTSTPMLLILIIAYLGCYLWLYRRLVKFRAPALMQLRRRPDSRIFAN